MNETVNQKLLNCIEKVYEQSKDCKLASEHLSKLEPELQQLSEYFQVTTEQAFILSVIFVCNIKEETIGMNDLIKYFNCNPLKMIGIKADFITLIENNILIQHKSNNWRAKFFNNEEYSVNKEILMAISNNQPMPKLQEKPIGNVMELLEKIDLLCEKRESEEIITIDLFLRFNYLLENNQQYPLVKKILSLKLETEDNFVYVYCIWKVLKGKKTVDLQQMANLIYDSNHARINFLQKMQTKERSVIINDLLEVLETNFFNDVEVRLTNKSINILEDAGLKIIVNKKRNDSLIEASKIPAKKLYFNQEETNQLEMVKKTLQANMFKKTQKRLQEKNLPVGITILLHGSPGTGKTETVLQLAKETKRDIFKIEISKSKSMWFGESEKIIKRIFTEYQQFAEECERTPILFLNEADAVISKRKDSSASNVAQTENAMQNILLEELENFKGILCATTNLISNLDLAFERRFLFKIELKNPEEMVKEKIWKSKLPKLKLSECKVLAQKYNFSGGQIENIVRKNEINEIINGHHVNFNSILEFCKTEQFQKNNHRPAIGFNS